ncbi:hypothetical protein SRABI27_00353 [Pedobacter sp. Bi27]|uniref:DUF4153 domain-containing protein n=1 Tax=unclassified Pedobacter TaxID=2628915 RepID=UPI001D838A07|nr:MULTISPECIES: DUF4173 domain-containing protein [unclassified Pedobacter]CAH0143690.1 hypothetical protein SRABI126_00358 [Pedobacter sp. Bi126]CAH0144071.1 hypothetical protein SRABI27_00353 [Pedobacter sp. Bi27]CAH0214655.1 hypothetical protein SRABI36_02323 [Pedobacter sp. Bi36]
MKNRSNLLSLSVLLGGLLFTFLFWQERLALNLLIYSIYLLAITFINPDVVKSTKLKIYGLAHLLAAVLVVVNNSDLSVATYYISLLLFIGFSHNQQIRTIFAAFLASILQMITVPFNAVKHLSKISIGNFNLKPFFKLIKYIFIPVIAVIFFTCLYSAANNVFAHYAESVLTNIGQFFEDILHFFFKDLSIERIIHFCFGLALTGGLLLTFFDKTLEKAELTCKEQLVRIRRTSGQKTIWYHIVETFSGNLLTRKMALKTEYIVGIISFVALNVLLLLLNAIDITTLWFGYKPSGNFSGELHQGTNTLIFSIVMAMAVILYFFRGNLNFYRKSKTLRALAFTWMVQNFILIISVFIRDGYYIEFHGLTHKRIGVLVFATLCIIGLATVYFKVAKQKTIFYLFKVNGNIWFALLLAFSLINWDVFIVKYNLAQSDKVGIDADYLLSLSDKTLPILYKNRSKLDYTPSKDLNGREIAKPQTADFYRDQLDRRIGYFKERYESVSWLSWNLQDWNTAEYFGDNKN